MNNDCPVTSSNRSFIFTDYRTNTPDVSFKTFTICPPSALSQLLTFRRTDLYPKSIQFRKNSRCRALKQELGTSQLRPERSYQGNFNPSHSEAAKTALFISPSSTSGLKFILIELSSFNFMGSCRTKTGLYKTHVRERYQMTYRQTVSKTTLYLYVYFEVNSCVY